MQCIHSYWSRGEDELINISCEVGKRSNDGYSRNALRSESESQISLISALIKKM